MDMNKRAVIDDRVVYAADSSRSGAHYIRRHRLRLLLESPLHRDSLLLGTAIVEVLHLDEIRPDVDVSNIFDVDVEWQKIGHLLFDYNTQSFLEEVYARYECLMWKPNIALLRHIRLQPEYRGQGKGAEFLTTLRRHFSSSCGIMITFSEGTPKPAGMAHPLLPDHWERDEPFPQNRLLRGLKEAGFANVGKAHLFINDLQTTLE